MDTQLLSGTYYHCSQVDFRWQDCSHRIESLNILLYLLDKVKKIEKKLQDRKDIKLKDVVKRNIDLLSELTSDLSIDWPEYEFSNPLDKRMRELRLTELESIKASLNLMKKSLDSMLGHFRSAAAKPSQQTVRGLGQDSGQPSRQPSGDSKQHLGGSGQISRQPSKQPSRQPSGVSGQASRGLGQLAGASQQPELTEQLEKDYREQIFNFVGRLDEQFSRIKRLCIEVKLMYLVWESVNYVFCCYCIIVPFSLKIAFLM